MTDHGALVLGIETSCDETAAAVVDGGTRVLSSVVSSQVDLHAKYGGVVPEIAGARASRAPDAGDRRGAGAGRGGGEGSPRRGRHDRPGLDRLAARGGCEAKALALAWDVPFAGVNHLEGHLFAALLDHPGHRVAGGGAPGLGRPHHAPLDGGPGALQAARRDPRRRGRGGLRQGGSIPGPRLSRGPVIEQAAVSGDPTAFAFPRALLGEGLDFSFSGIKTAVVHAVRPSPTPRRGCRGVVPAGRGGCARGQGHPGGGPGRGPGHVPGRRGGGQRPVAPGPRRRLCRVGLAAYLPTRPCAPTTRPWSPPRAGGSSSTWALPPSTPAADPYLRLALLG